MEEKEKKSKFVKCPNGMVWRVNENNFAEGAVRVPDYESLELEPRLDAISEAATGSLIGLTDFSYRYFGNDVVFFGGVIDEVSENHDEDETVEERGYQVLANDSPELVEALSKQYGLIPTEVIHVLDNLDNDYGEETVIPIVGSFREIRCPAYPAECNYVRVVVAGQFETAYWVSDEWQESPAEVIGAFLGAANG